MPPHTLIDKTAIFALEIIEVMTDLMQIQEPEYDAILRQAVAVIDRTRATEQHNLSRKWIDSSRTDNASLYYRVCIVKYFLDVVSPQNDLSSKLSDLFNKFPQIDLSAMGFPYGWKNEPLWH